jgi:hydroxypyruvate isomerase
MNISVCVDAVYRGQDFADSLRHLAAAGVTAFEFWGWWDKDVARIQQVKEEVGLTAVALCTHFISLVDPSQRTAYLQGLEQSIHVAQQLGASTLISQVGNDTGAPRAQQQQSLIDGLKTAVPLLEKANIQLAFEPLNVLVDHPGYYLTRSDEAFAIATAVNSPHVKVLFDIYHQQITEGNVIRNIVAHIDKIGHFHAAGNPGRHELQNGELNYPEIFRAIDATGYQGYVGLEYFPLDEPLAGIRPFL